MTAGRALVGALCLALVMLAQGFAFDAHLSAGREYYDGIFRSR